MTEEKKRVTGRKRNRGAVSEEKKKNSTIMLPFVNDIKLNVMFWLTSSGAASFCFSEKDVQHLSGQLLV